MDNLTRSFFALTVAGTAVAIYHAYSEITANFNFCNINSSLSCANVFASGYVSIFGIPFYAMGLIWFPVLFLLGVWFVRGETGQLRGDILVPLLMIGNVFTVYLWYLELVRIHAICPVCVSLYAMNYVLTALCFPSAVK